MNKKGYFRVLGDSAGATEKERTAYDLGVKDADNKLVEWRPYKHFSDDKLINQYESTLNLGFFRLSGEVAILATFWYIMRPFFWAMMVLMILYLLLFINYNHIRRDKLKRELRIRNKGRW